MSLLTAGSVGLAVIALANSWLLSRKSPAGWLGSLLFQALATPYDIATAQYGFLLLTPPSVIIAVRGYRRFRADQAAPEGNPPGPGRPG